MLGVILLAQALTLAVSGPAASIAYLPIRVALADGYFTREGLAVTVRPVRNAVEAADALVLGSADLAATTLEAMARRASGEAGSKVRLALGLTAAPPVALLASATSPAPPRTVADLAGRKIAIGSPGPDETWLVAILARSRLDPRKLQIVGVGDRNLGHALETADAAAALVAEPLAGQLLASGHATLLADLRTHSAAAETLDAPTVDAAVFARADRLPRPGILAAFSRAILAAEQRIAGGDAAGLGAHLPREITARPEEFAARVAAAAPVYLPTGEVSVERVRTSLDLIARRIPLPLTGQLPKASELVITRPR